MAGACALLAGLMGCAGPAWEKRYRTAVAEIAPIMGQNALSTPRYRICSDSPNNRAAAIGAFMEQAVSAYDRLLRLNPSAPAEPSILWLYTDRGRYRQVAASMGFHPTIPAFFSPVAPAAIHVRWDPSDGKDLFPLLLHEGLHQQVNARWRIRSGNGPDTGDQGQIGIPLWLNEGLAAYMESARIIEGRLVTGEVNRDRLRELMQKLQKKRLPDLEAVLSRPYGKPFDSGDYAIVWGLVWDLKHGAGTPPSPDAPDLLDRYLEALKNDLEAGYRTLADNGRAGEKPAPAIGFQAWNPVLAQHSLALFAKIVTGETRPITAWAQEWRQRMLNLGAEQGLK